MGSNIHVYNYVLRLKCNSTRKTTALHLAQQAVTLTEHHSPPLPPPLQQK